MTNLLYALSRIQDTRIKVRDIFQIENRVNSVGEGLEFFIKDLFCDSFSTDDINKKIRIYQEHFSYLGNSNNPPDFVIKKGDAVEVKKITSVKDLALNSSYPKNQLFNTDSRISNACKTCEDQDGGWKVKDMLYTIGNIRSGKELDSLWFVYGNCYAASPHVYRNVAHYITDSVQKGGDYELSATNELARINKIDPLGITYLRVRGMWGIQHPDTVFSYITDPGYQIKVLMLSDKYHFLAEKTEQGVVSFIESKFNVKHTQIHSPNNPASNLEAVLLQGNF